MSEKDETFGRRCIIQRTNETTTILGMREREEREREKEREKERLAIESWTSVKFMASGEKQFMVFGKILVN